MSAVDCCSDCRSVLIAMNSTPWTSASTMRLTALTPAPPTPTTRRTGWPTGRAWPHGGGLVGRGADASCDGLRRTGSSAGGAARMSSGMSELNAWRRRSCGVGRRGWSSSTGAGVGAQRRVRVAGLARMRGGSRCCGSSRGARSRRRALRRAGALVRRRLRRAARLLPAAVAARRGGAAPAARTSGVAAAPRGAAARPAPRGVRPRRSGGRAPPAGPPACSRAYRLPCGENLLREIAIGLGGHPVRIVLQHRHALDGRLREPDRLPDPRREHAIAEVLLQDLDRLLGVDGARVHERRQDALDLDVRVEVLADHLQRVLQLDQPAHRQILALDGDDHLVGRRQGVDREQPEARRRVDADEVVVLRDRAQRLLERALAADLRATSRSRRRRGRSTRTRRRSRACGSPRGSTMWWTSTSYIDVSSVSGSMPCDIVRLPCGSMSTHRTR